MPPTKRPPKPKTETDSAAVLALFAQNLEEIRRWYRGARDTGREMGHIVLSELMLSNVSCALDLALQGKRWEKPVEGP